MNYSVDFTDEEATFLNSIELDQGLLNYDRLSGQTQFVVQLMESLLDRGAIPEIRLLYWNDPEYKVGRPKISHKGLFERSHDSDAAIYEHANFLDYLRYFIFGAQLPEKAIAEFEEVVGKPEWVLISPT